MTIPAVGPVVGAVKLMIALLPMDAVAQLLLFDEVNTIVTPVPWIVAFPTTDKLP
jgi:hypothetical protein